MADPVLSFDALLMIMALLSRSDGLNMSMTCRTLRHGGARFLLEGGVALTTSGQAISLIKFVRADAGNRAHHLRNLKISGNYFSSKAVDALKGLVTTPHLALNSLVLTDAEAILMPDLTSLNLWDTRSSTLFSAFSSLSTLKHLTIDRCDEHAFAFIRSLPSSLTTATLNLEPLATWSVITDPGERNPILLLTNSSHTLVELCGTGFDIDPAIIKYDIVYPSVRRISAEYTSPAMPGTLAYIHAFPNLEYLSLTSPNNRFDDPAVDELEDPLSTRPLIVDIRAANRDDQVNYGCTWHRLREVSGSLVDLYVLGLACQVPKVRILDTITEWTCTLLPDVLADVRPSCLVITFAGMSMFGTGGSLYWMLREREAHLRALELEVRCSANEGAWSLGGIVDVICGTLNRTPLQSLALTLNCVALTRQSPCRRPRIGGVPNDEESCTLVRELESADLHLYHQRFREALPSLKDISVRLSVESLALDDEDDCASILSSESSVGEMDPDLATFMIEEDDEGW